MIHRAAILVPLSLAAACAGERAETPAADSTAAAARPPAAPDSRPLVVFLGTSLTAGLGVDPEQAYPALLQRVLDSAGIPLRAVNAGVSGETSAGALRRLPFVLQGPIRVLVIETGANDGLRGLDVDSTRANLEAIIAQVRSHDPAIRILLAAMEAPPNMGPRFTARFRAMFPDLARRASVPLVPFLLSGVGGVDSLNQSDGIHPTPAGHRIVARNVWAALEPVARAAGGTPAAVRP